MKFKNPFKKRKKYSSPYYGGAGPLVNAPVFPKKEDEERKPVLDISKVRVPIQRPTELDWEQRRFELVKMLISQERKSVVLGKLKANDKQIAEKALSLADAAIKELQNHPMSHGDRREKTDA